MSGPPQRRGSQASVIHERVRAAEARLDRNEVFVRSEFDKVHAKIDGNQAEMLRRVDDGFRSIHEDSVQARKRDWAPLAIIATVAVAVVTIFGGALTFGLSVWITRGDQLQVVMYEHAQGRIQDLDQWRDEVRLWADQTNRDIGRFEAQLERGLIDIGTLQEVDRRVRWIQGYSDEANRSIRTRLEALEKTNPRRPINARPERPDETPRGP